MFPPMKTHISSQGNVAVEVVVGIVAVVGVVLGIAAIKSSGSVNTKFDGIETRLNSVETAVTGIQQLDAEVRQVRSSVAIVGALQQDVQGIKDQLAKKSEPAPVKGGAAVGGKAKTEGNAEVAAGPGTFHTIQAHDTLGKIARERGTTVAALEKLNPNLNPNRLKPGTKIRVK